MKNNGFIYDDFFKFNLSIFIDDFINKLFGQKPTFL